MQFAVFEKFTSAYWHHIAQEIILLLVNNTHEKNITNSQDKHEFWQHTPFVIYTCVTTLHSCYMRMHSFSANQSDMHNFFMYIINTPKNSPNHAT